MTGATGIARDQALTQVAAAQAGIVLGDEFFDDMDRNSAAFSNAVSAALQSLTSQGEATGTLEPAASLGRNPEAALETIARIDDTNERWRALQFVAASALDAGDHEGLQAPMRAMAALLKGDGETFIRVHEFTLLLLVTGEFDESFAIARQLAGRGVPSFLLAYTAWVQAQVSGESAAEATLREIAALPPVRGGDCRDHLNYLVALAQANAGDLSGALSTADRIGYAGEKARALVAIALDQPPPDFQVLLALNFP